MTTICWQLLSITIHACKGRTGERDGKLNMSLYTAWRHGGVCGGVTPLHINVVTRKVFRQFCPLIPKSMRLCESQNLSRPFKGENSLPPTRNEPRFLGLLARSSATPGPAERCNSTLFSYILIDWSQRCCCVAVTNSSALSSTHYCIP